MDTEGVIESALFNGVLTGLNLEKMKRLLSLGKKQTVCNN